MASHEPAAGDAIPAECKIIEVHVPELRRLFNAMDPSPFNDRDLDPNAEQFIVSWARELPRNAPLALLVDLDRDAGPRDEATALGSAVHEFFHRRGSAYRLRLRHLFGSGRISLLIGLAFLAASIAVSDLLATYGTGHAAQIVRESVSIGGWVAMWRPLEIFLYDWWPLSAEARLSDRLAAMPVQIRYRSDERRESWKHDWPAEPASPKSDR